MKLIALCGAAGAGKDTVADMLPARKLAFADTLYAEVAAAFEFMVADLKCRATKEVALRALRLTRCVDDGFLEFNGAEDWGAPRSPRQILQWWGDYRRAQDPDYFVAQTWAALVCGNMLNREHHVITDVRFPNEAAMVRQLGGKIWQVRRPGYEAGGTGHASDTDGSEFEPDEILWNQNTLEELRVKVLKYWEGV